MSFDMPLFLTFIADYIGRAPGLSKTVESIYQRDKERFYQAARNSPYYDKDTILTNGGLMAEVRRKRIYGVLMAAETDKALYAELRGILVKVNGEYPKLIDKPSEKDLMEFSNHCLKKYGKTKLSMSYLYILVYLLTEEYGIESIAGFSTVQIMSAEVYERTSFTRDRTRQWLKRTNPFDYLSISKEDLRLARELKTASDFQSLPDAFDNLHSGAFLVEPKNQLIAQAVKKAVIDAKGRPNDMEEATRVIFTASNLCNYFGLSLFCLLEPYNCLKEETMTALKAAASIYTTHDTSGPRPFSFSDCTKAILLYSLIKYISDTKIYYFENNDETMFSELSFLKQQLQEKDEKTTASQCELEHTRTENERLRRELQAAEGKLAQTSDDKIKQYEQKLRECPAQNAELTKQLAHEREKTSELNALRSFAFDLQSDYVPQETTTSLASIAAGKKIVIIGGHINWRNNIKSRFPDLSVLDGTVKTLSTDVVQSADMVFFNTANMVHPVYEKVMDVLRKKNIPFDYLGRSGNPNLVEQEMVSLLIQHGWPAR